MARVPLPPAEPMKLTVLAEIASGGMGSVEMARVESGELTGQVLAIKRLHQNIANDKTFVDMFLDEAWLTAAMKSPHVMGVVAHGTDERGMFLAVELIEGVPLSRLLKEARVKKETFSEQIVACITMQICEGLLEAHSLKGSDGKPLGLVHRDLTPGNVLVSFEGNVKIVDFGIAKAEERITHTRTGTMKGKPAYMAPEQAKGGKNMDLRADLFSLGVMMFELLAGRRPWLEKSAFDVIMAAALKPHPSIAELRPGVSPVFAEVIDKCLAKKPVERFGSAAEIRDKLIAWRRAQTFPRPDLEELRDFVARNSQAQIEWFRRARLGELIKGAAQTFKELEESIDEARKRSGEVPQSIMPPPTSNARAVFEAMTPSRAQPLVIDTPMQTPAPLSPIPIGRVPQTPPPGYTPPPVQLTPVPMTPPPVASPSPPRGPASDRALATKPSLAEASRIAQQMGPPASQLPSTKPVPTEPFPARRAVGLSGTIALDASDLEPSGDPARAQGPSPKLGLGGTAFIEESPLKGVKLPEPRAERSSEPDLYATIRVPELSDRPIQDVEGATRSVVRPVGAPPADEDLALGATLRSDEVPADALKVIREAPPPPAELPRAAEPTRADGLRATIRNQRGQLEEPPKGLSGTTVMLLILVAFIAGGAIAAYVAKTYLVKPSGALDSTSPAAPARGA